MMDIVFPNGNEKEFADMAERLGTKNLCFVYPLREFGAAKSISSKVNICRGLLLRPDEMRKARRGADIVLVKAYDDNRALFEGKGADMVYGLESHQHKDFLHHRNSGLNQVHCSLAKKNNIAVAMDFSSVLNADRIRCAKILGRMMQNARLCRKYKVEVVVASFAAVPYEMRSQSELEAFARIIGVSDAKASLNALHRKILANRKRQLPGYIADGAEQLDC